MNYPARLHCFVTSFVCLMLAAATQLPADEQPVSYTRDIRPLLANHCYACHGPDEKQRQADLRLDVADAALEYAIVPGSADDSELFLRVASDDPDLKMPPANSKKPALTPAEIESLRRWIDAGAPFDEHWAYVNPQRPPVPEIQNEMWARGPIDRFIAAGYQRHGFLPSPEADRRTLIRRLYFDLIGLPPTPQQVDEFNDTSSQAYENVVDRLLSSEHFGERMAIYWLDLVRYADTNGIHGDNHRDHDLYRDWVIKAFNENMPYDRFTIKQLAGDLFPNPSNELKIASGYNRLNMTTREGGAQAKEYIAKYAADRVRNASQVWLGSTMGCAECHNHKFDPFTQEDFYSLAAFFADVQETAVGAQRPVTMPQFGMEDEVKELDAEIAKVKRILSTPTPELDAAQAEWEKTFTAPEKDGPPKHVVEALAANPAERTEQQLRQIAEYYRSIAPLLKPARDRLAELEAKRQSITRPLLVSMSGKPRTVRVLPRGNWLDDSGQIVQPDTPSFLKPLDVHDRRANRLDLAHWLVDPENPLTARVFVNRLWKLAFGYGICRSLDDFGAQGTVPSHPELLDWLAVEFVESGWDVKHMLKLMVMSSTYRQSSFEPKPLRERDPANKWLVRQNRFRLDAEMVRDNALAVSGLLVRKIGGPSVKPYQPAGYWEHLNFPKRSWKHDSGEDQYRRALYTYWCRTFLHPSLLAFDAPTREDSCTQRPRSNTPLQALVLLNDPTYVEAARVFAARVIEEGGDSVESRLEFAYRAALSRSPNLDEAAILTRLFEEHRQQYRDDKASAEAVISNGEFRRPENIDVVELAAWTSVARVILNLHESITRF